MHHFDSRKSAVMPRKSTLHSTGTLWSIQLTAQKCESKQNSQLTITCMSVMNDLRDAYSPASNFRFTSGSVISSLPPMQKASRHALDTAQLPLSSLSQALSKRSRAQINAATCSSIGTSRPHIMRPPKSETPGSIAQQSCGIKQCEHKAFMRSASE